MDLEKEVKRYKAGEEKAFDNIYNETYSLVRFAIYSKIPNKHIVEDLIQDTYMKANNNIASYEQNSFRSWIYNIAKNTALDYLKRKKKITANYLEDNLDIKSNHPYLYYAIRHLEEIEREVFLLKVLCGHTTKRIADILDLKPSRVNEYFYLAKNKLKEALQDYEV